MFEEEAISAVLDLMEVPSRSGVYVLGCFGRYITVYSQQVRALNLVYALNQCSKLKTDTRVCVVGAGIAGLTAAVGAARLGATVQVLEKRPRVMGLQKGSTQRFLHPHIYDWPAFELESDSPGLPFFDWSASTAEDVVNQIDKEWAKELELNPRILPPIFSVSDVALENDDPGISDPGIRITWNEPNKGTQGIDFDIVILAVGFGSEMDVTGAQHGYWEDDRLVKVHESVKSCLVSGTGDGGLTDLMQLCIRDFRHDRIVNMFANDARSRSIGLELLQVESDYRGQPRKLSDYYQKLHVPHVQELLGSMLRKDTDVTLTGGSFLKIYGGKSSILNRFIVSQLMHLKAWKWVLGPIQFPLSRNSQNKFAVRFRAKDGIEKSFDILITRHGPETPALQFGFPDIWHECEDLAKRWRALPQNLDLTRKRLPWKDAFETVDDIELTPASKVGPIRLVAFDLDGTLLRANNYKWSWPLVWTFLGYPDSLRARIMAQYRAQRYTHNQWYKAWCDRSARLFKKKGLKRSHFAEITSSLMVTDGMRETIQELKARGVKLAIISGGIDVFLEEKIPDYKSLFDYVYINQFRFDDEGAFIGVLSTKYDFEEKWTAVELICKTEGFSPAQTVFVGDGFNDADVIGKGGRTIAFTPTSAEMTNADFIVHEADLRKILPFLFQESASNG
ncbi:MAG TPA: HAD-IB family phosphatase [Verrucomicrobiae bacterium]|nr:HAD-IB family phosphatase [Verrucomicrobiae bacterium]